LAGEHSWRNPFAESLIARNKKEGLEKRIVFLGHIHDTTRLLEQAQLHVCPSTSKSESFPNVILEAKKAGLPSVVFRTAGIPEAVQDEKEGRICEHKTADCLAHGIRRYIDDPVALRLHGMEAQRSLSRYDEDRIQETWTRLLEL
jgi:glycosyltransferase involved in cell wall biosynthesis